MKLNSLFISISILFLLSCEGAVPKQKPAKTPVSNEKNVRLEGMPIKHSGDIKTNSDRALAYFSALENGDGKFFRENVPKENHFQHNAYYKHGNEGYKTLVKESKASGLKVDVYRLAEFNDYVFAHSVFKDSLSSSVGIDIFKFSNNKIVEHWFGREEINKTAENPSIQFDGSFETLYGTNDAVSSKVAANFIRFLRIEGEYKKQYQMVSENYTEHNSLLAKSRNPVGNYYFELK